MSCDNIERDGKYSNMREQREDVNETKKKDIYVIHTITCRVLNDNLLCGTEQFPFEFEFEFKFDTNILVLDFNSIISPST